MGTTLNINLPWEEVKEKLLEAEPYLTEADLAYEKGKEEELLERLGKKMGRTSDQIKGWIESVAYTDGLAG
ncbi:hypothetical protein WG954_09300 [Lacibacter sp. H375]|uniref:hypothetical protein n=1 Tax=Lacibacter sp. H375 TaxID=3133424 RepID=UPI0030BE0F3F